MATVYSLICWGGRTGKSVTASSTTDYVTLTNHGLRSATGVRFLSGTLPTVASGAALDTSTTYYAKPIASNTFELYRESALTTKIDFTNNGSSLYMVSAYFSGLTSGDKSRYGSAGSERIYDGLAAWNTGRAAAGSFDTEVCEIGMAWDDYTASQNITVPSAETLITSKVNGVRSSAYHAGISGAGYRLYRYSASNSYTLILSSIRCTCDGFEVYLPSTVTGYGPGGVRLVNYFGSLKNMIVRGRFDYASGGNGISCEAPFSNAENCLSMGWNYGVYITNYTAGVQIANCTSAKNAYGFFGYSGANISGWYYNNIAIGNTTANWQAIPSGLTAASNNAGISGDTVWKTGTNPTITTLTADNSTFFDYAGNDYRAANSSCPQVDTGIVYYGYEDYSTDLADAERPSYNNGGAEAFDVGCYEFDNGYGLHPTTSTIALTNIVSGTRILITRDDTGAVLYNDVPGTSLTQSVTYIGAFTVVARKASVTPFYREFIASGVTVANQTTSIKLLQQLDE